MGRPKEGYFLNDGITRVPSVTTILSRFKDSGGLIHWAWTQGRDGHDYRETRDRTADAGSLAHALVEATLKGGASALEVVSAGVPEDIYDKAWQAYRNWAKWRDQTGLVITPWEKPLVCEHYRYGGTPDALLTLDGKVCVGDWKSSGGGTAYPEHLLQLAAYAHLFADAGMELTPGFHLCTFSRENGDFVHRYFGDLADEWRAFTLMAELYPLMKAAEKRVK